VVRGGFLDAQVLAEDELWWVHLSQRLLRCRLAAVQQAVAVVAASVKA
jgi:hypothetical protein